ncbi:MAG: class I SAM-dependent methyltransferase [Thermoplasmata archaeon]|nr:class I SAM-dependent methyltransferase [Thermoplasmata archaeon]
MDFTARWKGRGRTTEVETALTLVGLANFAPDRIAELGTGDGRLSPVVRAVAAEYIGVDQSLEFLRRVRDRLPPISSSLLVEANLYHLPFVDGTLSAALLARVYNFLTNPGAGLREIHRVLGADGGLVLTCNPRPSTTMLLDDVRAGMTRPTGGRPASMTFGRGDQVPAHRSPIPAVAPTRGFLRRMVREAGFGIEQTLGSGFEDSRFTRFLPARSFVKAGRELGSAPVFPLVWTIARSLGVPLVVDRPPLQSSIACPRCRRPFGELALEREFEVGCDGCGFVLRMTDGILRARYVEA